MRLDLGPSEMEPDVTLIVLILVRPYKDYSEEIIL